MPNTKDNVLRQYHLLITRYGEGFAWQIRYDRHANPVRRSIAVFPTQAEAETAGEIALATLRSETGEDAP